MRQPIQADRCGIEPGYRTVEILKFFEWFRLPRMGQFGQ